MVENKNASVVRKTYGYAHIGQHSANELNAFNRQYLIPFINFHRPCYFATTIVDKKGKQGKRYDYEKMMTPYVKLELLN